VTSQPGEAAGPLIPMPQLTPDALRQAVAQLIPSRLAELNEHLAHAATSAQRTSSVGPLVAFTEHWATVINIERWPQRAARFHLSERTATDPLADPDAARSAALEVSRLLHEAGAEISA
jgi:hypothetical protein